MAIFEAGGIYLLRATIFGIHSLKKNIYIYIRIWVYLGLQLSIKCHLDFGKNFFQADQRTRMSKGWLFASWTHQRLVIFPRFSKHRGGGDSPNHA